MKKLLNDPAEFVEQTLDGLLAAHPDQFSRVPGHPQVLVRTGSPVQGKVTIITGGGSGHLPVFLGYVGEGLADGVAVGNVFASPSSEQIVAAARAAHGGSGCLFLYGNYMGDSMNFALAADELREEGIRVEEVRVSDDVASAPKENWQRRRAVAGLVFAYKIAGAAAQAGLGLDEVKAVAEDAVSRIRSMGVALTPCIVPSVGKPTFTIGDGEMEVGMGIHGEPGVARVPLETAADVANRLVQGILADGKLHRGDDVAVLVNGLGATPREELYILYRTIDALLKAEGLQVRRVYIGEYATSMEMAGASLTLFQLDARMERYLSAPAHSHLVPDLT